MPNLDKTHSYLEVAEEEIETWESWIADMKSLVRNSFILDIFSWSYKGSRYSSIRNVNIDKSQSVFISSSLQNVVGIGSMAGHYLSRLMMVCGSLNGIGLNSVCSLLHHKLTAWSRDPTQHPGLASLNFVRGKCWSIVPTTNLLLLAFTD